MHPGRAPKELSVARRSKAAGRTWTETHPDCHDHLERAAAVDAMLAADPTLDRGWLWVGLINALSA